MIVSFYLEPLGHETFFYRDAVYGSSICRRLKDIFGDAVVDIKLEDKEYVYQGKCKCTIIFNENYNRATSFKIKEDIKHILERVASAPKTPDEYKLYKYIININGNRLYEYINNEVNNDISKEYLITENFNLYTGGNISIISFYYFE